MRNHLNRLKHKVHNSILDAARRIETHTLAIGTIGAIGFLFYYILWSFFFPQPYESLTLRATGSFLCFVIMIKELWPDRLHKYFPYIWYMTLLYILPFFFTYMLFMNNFSHLWMLAILCSIFLLILLVDWVSLLILWLTGALLAILAFQFVDKTLTVANTFWEDLTLFPFAVISGIFIRYQTDRETKEKLHGILTAGGSIAHELRTPLLGIKTGVAGLKRYMPKLFEGYTLAKEAGLPVSKIRSSHYQALEPVLQRIEEETDYSNVIIDMLLMNAGKQIIDSSSFKHYSMKSCVEDALNRYPFSSESEQKLIKWNNTGDFAFWGSDALMVHVLFNLIKNALYFIAQAGKGEIHIWLAVKGSSGYLHFKDTGTGVPASILPHMFERFYSSTDTGTGIGLSFCQRVIRSFGGSIECQSIEGEFTEFVLKFPIEARNDKA